ncbi:hypothetical protein [Streptomyces pinistramenti]|uniref:hypothetical protein n=1 Tax=Streptomyces pinistramenti TaxID=2884812 RepID=UPI001D07C1F2|nr:hypothetical protein [Streptomyces pinistramenti]MCB5908116.1 hypothetical protein [Streptomyces pinistramenti]
MTKKPPMESMQPACVEQARVPDDADRRAAAEKITEAHQEQMAPLAARPANPHTTRQRQELDRAYADVISPLPYDADATPVFQRPRD